MALVALAHPLVSVLYERGAFDAADTKSTALALAVYGVGLPAFVLQKVLQPLYYAREDTRRPFHYAIMSMLVNAGLAISFMPIIGFLASAFATSFSAWVMVMQLWRGARKMGDAAKLDVRLLDRLPRIILACFAMLLVLAVIYQPLEEMITQPSWRYLALFALVFGGMISYGLTGLMFGAFRLNDLGRLLRR